MTGPPSLWDRAWAEAPRLLRIARRRSLNRADAEDVVQEAIVRCVTHPGLDPARLAGMLTTVTVRLCVDKLRDRVASERAVSRLRGPLQVDAESIADMAWLAAEAANLVGRERAAVLAAPRRRPRAVARLRKVAAVSAYRRAVQAAWAERPDLRVRAPLDGLRHAARTLRLSPAVRVGPVVARAALLFDPRDLWVGLYVEPDGEEVTVYACLVPTLPLRLVVTGRGLYDAQAGA